MIRDFFDYYIIINFNEYEIEEEDNNYYTNDTLNNLLAESSGESNSSEYVD